MKFSDEILKDIHEYCIGHESFHKNEILLTYGIAEEDYNDLRDEVLKRFPDLEGGAHKAGGFRRKTRRYRKTEEDEDFSAGVSMIGRGLRGARFGGTEKVEIIDCIDNFTANKPVLGYDQHFEVWGKELATL